MAVELFRWFGVAIKPTLEKHLKPVQVQVTYILASSPGHFFLKKNRSGKEATHTCALYNSIKSLVVHVSTMIFTHII